MAEFTIYIGNKNYSSWSLRGWLMLKAAGVAVRGGADPALTARAAKASCCRHSPSGKVPALRHGGGHGLGIAGDRRIPGRAIRPERGSGPRTRAARAVARAVSAEMHAGFAQSAPRICR